MASLQRCTALPLSCRAPECADGSCDVPHATAEDSETLSPATWTDGTATWCTCLSNRNAGLHHQYPFIALLLHAKKVATLSFGGTNSLVLEFQSPNNHQYVLLK